jgi:hypothetical protein
MGFLMPGIDYSMSQVQGSCVISSVLEIKVSHIRFFLLFAVKLTDVNESRIFRIFASIRESMK